MECSTERWTTVNIRMNLREAKVIRDLLCNETRRMSLLTMATMDGVVDYNFETLCKLHKFLNNATKEI